MNQKAVWIGAIVSIAMIAVAQVTGSALAINVNGKSVPGKTLISKGETYVPMSALKAAGVTSNVKSGVLYLGLTPAGGANQINALEGKVGDWLFNGIWRFRVESVVPNDDGRPGWKVNVELRNGTKLDNVAIGGTGFHSLSLIMADGNALSAYNITDLDRPLGQGAGVKVPLVFYDDEGNGRKPEKLIIRIAPDDATRSFLKNQGASYAIGDPSFRVNLKTD